MLLGAEEELETSEDEEDGAALELDSALLTDEVEELGTSEDDVEVEVLDGGELGEDELEKLVVGINV